MGRLGGGRVPQRCGGVKRRCCLSAACVRAARTPVFSDSTAGRAQAPSAGKGRPSAQRPQLSNSLQSGREFGRGRMQSARRRVIVNRLQCSRACCGRVRRQLMGKRVDERCTAATGTSDRRQDGRGGSRGPGIRRFALDSGVRRSRVSHAGFRRRPDQNRQADRRQELHRPRPQRVDRRMYRTQEIPAHLGHEAAGRGRLRLDLRADAAVRQPRSRFGLRGSYRPTDRRGTAARATGGVGKHNLSRYDARRRTADLGRAWAGTWKRILPRV